MIPVIATRWAGARARAGDSDSIMPSRTSHDTRVPRHLHNDEQMVARDVPIVFGGAALRARRHLETEGVGLRASKIIPAGDFALLFAGIRATTGTNEGQMAISKLRFARLPTGRQ